MKGDQDHTTTNTANTFLISTQNTIANTQRYQLLSRKPCTNSTKKTLQK